jgi:Glycosyltransferase family 87
VAAAAAVLVLVLPATAATARAQAPGSLITDPNALTSPSDLHRPPPNHVHSADEVLAIANRLPDVRHTLRTHPGATHAGYLKGALRWQVSYFGRRRGRQLQGPEIAQVLIDDRTGIVLEHWTGFQVAWSMARGYPGAFGRKAVALYVWLPLCGLFLVPFVDPRRPFRMLHLDLLVLLAFSISLAFFSRGEIGLSVPLAYPPLIYLLVRMVMLARRRGQRDPPEPLKLLVPTTALAIALVFLVGFRVGLNVTNSNVIDVGYSGVIGADRLADGSAFYGHFPHDNEHGDTYGPVNYYAYVPFEQALPWSGTWDDLPAAHAAAVAFDLLTLLGLWLLGRRLRGPRLGWVLAYAWAAYPFTLFVSNSNSNDALVAMLLTLALLVARWAPARGAAVALAGLTKFAPLALAPLFAAAGPAGVGPARRLRGVALFALGFAVTVAIAMLPVLVGDEWSRFYDRTIEFQRSRGSPFSVWGFYGWDTAQTVVQAGALAFAAAAAFIPRRRDLIGLAALAGAVVIALQLGVTHWFYLYVVWFLPFVLVALLGRYAEPAR